MLQHDWQPLVRQGRVLLVGDVAILDLREGYVQTVEQVYPAVDVQWTGLQAFLNAPAELPPMVEAGDPEAAYLFASNVGFPQAVLDRIQAGVMPFYDDIPPDLVYEY
jgi:hypothetical protein